MRIGALILLIAVFVTSCQQAKKDTNKTTGKTPKPSISENTDPLAAIKVGKGPDAMFLTPDKLKLYIANVGDTTVSVIDVKTDKVVKTIRGIHYPWGFSKLAGTDQVAVSAYDKQLVIIDFEINKIIKEKKFETPVGGIVTSKDGKHIYIVGIDAKKVFKLDAITLNIVDEYSTDNGPDGVGLSANGKYLYVTNTKDGTISVINTQNKDSRKLQVGGKPELIHHNHDRSKLYISNFLKGKIHVIDANKGEIVHEINNLDGPEEAVPNQDESLLYVVNFNKQKVFVYETDDYTKLPIEYKTGSKPIGVTLLEEKMYITNYGDNSVSVIKLENK